MDEKELTFPHDINALNERIKQQALWLKKLHFRLGEALICIEKHCDACKAKLKNLNKCNKCVFEAYKKVDPVFRWGGSFDEEE